MLSATNKLILAFVTLIVGLVIIGSLAAQGNLVTDKRTAANESYNLTDIGCYASGEVNGTTDAGCNITVSYAPSGWEQTETGCYLSGVTVGNNTYYAMTEDTDYYLFENTGIIQMLNTSSTNLTGCGNNVRINYTYCGSDYLNLSWGRTAIDIVPGFFAIALLLISVGLFYSVAREYGIIGKGE